MALVCGIDDRDAGFANSWQFYSYFLVLLHQQLGQPIYEWYMFSNVFWTLLEINSLPLGVVECTVFLAFLVLAINVVFLTTDITMGEA